MKSIMESSLYLLMFFCLINLSSSLYFHIAETERKCFIEEIPDETMVVGKYKCQLYDPNTGGYMPSSPGVGVSLEMEMIYENSNHNFLIKRNG